MFDYESLRLIWWLLLGTLLAGFAVTDGFDLGVGALLPFIAKKDIERRIVINTIGPVWEGNQVWIILGAGAIFAAWPIVYAVSFSGFYLAMLLVLAGFILRPVGFKYRSKIDNPTWRKCWDCALFLGGFVPALIFGVAIGNVLQGAPFHFDNEIRSFYTGSFWGLLNPFALLCGLVSLTMVTMHGSLYLSVKTEGIVQQRAIRYSRILGILMLILFSIAGFCIAYDVVGYQLVGQVSPMGPSNPLYSHATQHVGAWMNNYHQHPLTILVPALVYLCVIAAMILSSTRYAKLAFTLSSLAVIAVVFTVGVSMFPFILPSSTAPNMSLTVWNSSSSKTTLDIMLVSTAIFLPMILLYTAWVYRVLRGKITENTILSDSGTMY